MSALNGNPIVTAMLRQFNDALSRSQPRALSTGPRSFARWAKDRVYIRTKPGDIVNLDMNRAQRHVEAIILRRIRSGLPRRFLILKSRKIGISTYSLARGYRGVVTRSNTKSIMLAHTKTDAQELFTIARLMAEKDAKSPGMSRGGSKSRLEFPTLNSSFMIGTAGSRAFGRGQTPDWIHWSEVAWSAPGPNQIEDQRKLLAALTGAAGQHGIVLLETTPNGFELFHELWEGAKNNSNDWTPIFLPWMLDEDCSLDIDKENAEEIMASLDDEERALVAKWRLDAGQVAWRRQAKREYRQLFAQEFPSDDISCFLLTGACYFDTAVLIALLNSRPDPIRVEHVPGGLIRIWEDPQPGVRYVAGCDTSEGRPTSDPNGTGILNAETGTQVACLHGLFDPSSLAGETVKLCKRYNEALLGVEEENHGHAVLMRIKQLGYIKPQEQLYYRTMKRGAGWVDPGWKTTPKSRPVMLQNLADAVSHGEEGGMGIRDREFVSECLNFRLSGPGHYEAASGCHDDRVMKWSIAWMMRNVRRPERKIKIVTMPHSHVR